MCTYITLLALGSKVLRISTGALATLTNSNPITLQLKNKKIMFTTNLIMYNRILFDFHFREDKWNMIIMLSINLLKPHIIQQDQILTLFWSTGGTKSEVHILYIKYDTYTG